MNINTLTEATKIYRIQPESRFYVKSLRDRLDRLVGKLDKGFAGEFIFNDKDNLTGVIQSMYIKDNAVANGDDYKLDAEKVGTELLIIVKVTPSDKPYNPQTAQRVELTMKDLMNGLYEADSDELIAFVNSFNESKKLVEKEIKNEEEREKLRNMSPEERAKYNIMRERTFHALSSDTVDWLRQHIRRIDIWTKKSLIDYLKERFPKSAYIQNDDFGVKYGTWSEDSQSWGAKIVLDDASDCPDYEIKERALASTDMSVSSVGLADVLYRDYGFDFGKNPDFGKKIKKESLESTNDFEYVTSRGGYDMYRKIENGKGVWKAAKTGTNDMFDITYQQARGFDPIDDAQKMGQIVGNTLFKPAVEELNMKHSKKRCGFLIKESQEKPIKFRCLTESFSSRLMLESFKNEEKLARYFMKLKALNGEKKRIVEDEDDALAMAGYICDILGDYIETVTMDTDREIRMIMKRGYPYIQISAEWNHPSIEFHSTNSNYAWYKAEDDGFGGSSAWIKNPEVVKFFCERYLKNVEANSKEDAEVEKYSSNPSSNYKGFYKVAYEGSLAWRSEIFFNPETKEYFEQTTMRCDDDMNPHYNTAELYFIPVNNEVASQYKHTRKEDRIEVKFKDIK